MRSTFREESCPSQQLPCYPVLISGNGDTWARRHSTRRGETQRGVLNSRYFLFLLHLLVLTEPRRGVDAPDLIKTLLGATFFVGNPSRILCPRGNVSSSSYCQTTCRMMQCLSHRATYLPLVSHWLRQMDTMLRTSTSLVVTPWSSKTGTRTVDRQWAPWHSTIHREHNFCVSAAC